MSYVKKAVTRTVVLPSDPAYSVEWRDRIQYGALKDATRKAVTVDGQGNTKIDTSEYADAILLAHIAAWNLDGEDGKPLPLTQESLNLLEMEDSNFLAELLSAESAEKEKAQKNA